MQIIENCCESLSVLHLVQITWPNSEGCVFFWQCTPHNYYYIKILLFSRLVGGGRIEINDWETLSSNAGLPSSSRACNHINIIGRCSC